MPPGKAPIEAAPPADVEWRREQLERAGLKAPLARLLAEGDGDLHMMLASVAAGCPLHLLRRIFAPIPSV